MYASLISGANLTDTLDDQLARRESADETIDFARDLAGKVKDEATVGKLKLIIHEDIDHSTEINLNEWLQRPALQKLAENLCALMTPIL